MRPSPRLHASRARRILALLALAAGPCLAQAPAEARAQERFLVRLQGIGGQATLDGAHSTAQEAAVDVLLSANAFQRYGLRLSTLSFGKEGHRQRYVSTGIMIEMVTWGWCRMEVGTLGFVGRGPQSGANPFGLASFIGYERRVGSVDLSVGYDSKVIFTRPAIVLQSLCAGVGVHF